MATVPSTLEATAELPPTVSQSAPRPIDWSEPVDWAALVAQIVAGDERGFALLYAHFHSGIRYYMAREFGAQDLEDRVHETIVTVFDAIRSAELRDPNRLAGFIRTIVRRQVVVYIDRAVRRRELANLDLAGDIPHPGHNPEMAAILAQRQALVKTALRKLSPRDREVLQRFYVEEESKEHICDVMQITDAQFRLLKSRAKAKFGAIGQRAVRTPKLNRLTARMAA